MIEIQKFILDNGLAALETKAVKVIRSKVHPELILCKYDMIDSPLADTVVQQARGIILNEANSYTPVCRPFDKFFNHHEILAAKLDYESVKFTHKLDGSMCSLYFYNNRWNVSTSGNPDAGGNVDGSGITFSELFWQTFEASHMKLPADQALTYIFELTSALNRIVVRYDTPQLTLIGVRNTLTGKETDVYEHVDSTGINYRVPMLVDVMSNAEGLLANAELRIRDFDPVQLEGLVATDKYFNRLKLKSPKYVRLHHILGNQKFPTDSSLLDIIIDGESAEIKAYFPEWAARLTRLESAVHSFKSVVKNSYRKCFRLAYSPNIGPLVPAADMAPGLQRRTFAEEANRHWYAGILFTMLKLLPTETDLDQVVTRLVNEMSPQTKTTFLGRLDEYR